MKKRKLAVASALLCAAVLCACASPAAKENAVQTQAGGVTLTDGKGRVVTLAAPARRIVAMSPGDCEILYAIGAGDTIIGRGEYCDAPEAVLDVPSVQTGNDTNIEQILALAPDAVVISTMAQTLEQMNALESAGVKTVASEATDIAGVYRAIEMLGALTGRVDEAGALSESMRASFDALAQAAINAGGDGAKTVYFEVSPLEYNLWTAGSGTFMNEIAELLGLQNAFADVEGWAEISEEQVLARNPDYIVTIGMYFGEGPTPVEEILQRKGWQGVAAVQRGAVIAADNNAMARPGPRLVDAAQALYAAVYGESEALAPAA